MAFYLAMPTSFFTFFSPYRFPFHSHLIDFSRVFFVLDLTLARHIKRAGFERVSFSVKHFVPFSRSTFNSKMGDYDRLPSAPVEVKKRRGPKPKSAILGGRKVDVMHSSQGYAVFFLSNALFFAPPFEASTLEASFLRGHKEENCRVLILARQDKT